jgi:DNA processing protein
VSTLTSVADRAATEQVLLWLALGLTPGLGPTRARRLVEHFGSIAAVFRASLTELEATGLLAVSAQSLATGKSLELAQEEFAKTTAAGVTVISLDDTLYPPRLKQIYDPPLVLYVRGVDTAAHRGAIAAKGKTIAVFGTGVDVPYPKENSRLAEQILSLGGALISEFPLGTLRRHRIFRFATASSAVCRWASW